MLERDILARHFRFAADDSVLLGIGDDAAVLSPPPGCKLAMSSDSLLEGSHFFADADPFFLARKAAAVSLSDLAAMAARPLWMTVALAAREGESWLQQFAAGLSSSAADYRYAIVGGDLCRSEKVSITTTAVGATEGKWLSRGGAKVGDEVWLSGPTGEAALAAHYKKNKLAPPPEFADVIADKLNNPSPRLDLGNQLAGIATAAVDISDGLVSAAEAIAESSGLRVVLERKKIPTPPSLRALSLDLQNKMMLGGGDDYELLFCAPPSYHRQLSQYAHCIGETKEGEGAEVVDDSGAPIAVRGYEHDFGE